MGFVYRKTDNSCPSTEPSSISLFSSCEPRMTEVRMLPDMSDFISEGFGPGT
jgi:hypothetical protein